MLYFVDKNDKSENSYLVEELGIKDNDDEEAYHNQQSDEIYVHVEGEVKNPGVVKTKEGARIKDVIENAGGLTDSADASKINLAYEVKDGQKIIIPNKNNNTKINGETEINGNNKIYVENEEKDANTIKYAIEKSFKADYYIQEDDGGVIEQNENNNNKKININTASQSELEIITGIGPSTASKIIEYRNKNGKFKKIEDIKNVPGIGDSKFNNMKDEICV